MAKSEDHIEATRHKDITEQAYRGTNEVVSGLGYGALETKAGLIAGVPLGAIAGGLASEPVVKAQESLDNWLSTKITKFKSNKGMKRAIGFIPEVGLRITNWVVGLSDHTAKKMVESDAGKRVTKFLGGQGRIKGITAGATLGALAGFIIATVTGTAHGAVVASDGRNQFNDAKDEIRKLRREKAELEGKYEALQDAHKTAISHVHEHSDEIPDTAVDAATIEIGKRREDRMVETLPGILAK